MSKKILLIASISILVSLPVLAFAQLTFQGQVTDNQGTALPGANVIIVGTFYGTASDDEGNFTLLLPDPGAEPVIEARFVG